MSEDTIKQVIVVNKALNMRKGKMCAQVAHASMKFLLEGGQIDDIGTDSMSLCVLSRHLSPTQKEWLEGLFTKVVVSCDDEEELKSLILRASRAGVTVNPVIDSGLTEFHGVPTLTCVALGPERSSLLDPITGHLKLL